MIFLGGEITGKLIICLAGNLFNRKKHQINVIII